MLYLTCNVTYCAWASKLRNGYNLNIQGVNDMNERERLTTMSNHDFSHGKNFAKIIRQGLTFGPPCEESSSIPINFNWIRTILCCRLTAFSEMEADLVGGVRRLAFFGRLDRNWLIPAHLLIASRDTRRWAIWSRNHLYTDWHWRNAVLWRHGTEHEIPPPCWRYTSEWVKYDNMKILMLTNTFIRSPSPAGQKW